LLVVVLTALMMVVEIAAGLMYGSMALLADGLHMASHATALGLAVFAYVISRRLAGDRRFAFGVGKINSLAGFASAVMLLGFALLMVSESTGRLINPLSIAFDQALIVAAVGLIVNGVSAWILVSTPHEHGHGHSHHHHDHNLRGAYLHVMADAVTSLLAIAALLAGKYMGATWLDPAMGIVGAVLVARWSYGLIRESSRVLLDLQVDGLAYLEHRSRYICRRDRRGQRRSSDSGIL
jgi:cation diffusion facilitator family transporter